MEAAIGGIQDSKPVHWMGWRFWKRDRPEPRYPDDGPIVMENYSPVRAVEPGDEQLDRQAEADRKIETLTRERDALAERLSSLEHMLADPETGQNAPLYYRLRAVWRFCGRNLQIMAKRFSAKYRTQTGSRSNSDLPLDKRRAINTLLIALSQEYYLLFSEDQIAEMARQASIKPVESVHFGLAEECLRFGLKTRELAARARDEGIHGDLLRRRARYLHDTLRFEKGESIPREDSLKSMPSRIGGSLDTMHGDVEIISVNVLALDYWNLKAALSRAASPGAGTGTGK